MNHESALISMRLHHQAYTEKFTKWRKRAVECVQDPLWWYCIRVMNACRSPASHLSNFLKQKQGDWGHVAQLVAGKAASLSDEFMQAWSHISAAVDICELPLADRQPALDLAMDVLLHSASGFHRKITRPLLRDPYFLFFLVLAPPRRFCNAAFFVS